MSDWCRTNLQCVVVKRTPNTRSKLRAAKLQSYWKRICSDEEKSRQRNEKILQDFERIEGHLSSVSSRTEKLKLLKQQYENQLKEKYPQWKSMLAPQPVKQEQSEPDAVRTNQPEQQHQPKPNSMGASGKHQSHFQSNITAVHDLPYSHKSEHGKPSKHTPRSEKQKESGEITLEDLSNTGMGNKRDFSHEDLLSQIIQEEDDEDKLAEEPQDQKSTLGYSYSRPPPHVLQLQKPRQHEPPHTDHKPLMETLAEEEDEDGSDYGDMNVPDETLPIRHFHSADVHALENLTLDAEHTVPKTEQDQAEPTTPRSLLRSDSSSQKSLTPVPDLTLGGLLFLLKSLQEEIPTSVNVDSYYRCQHPAMIDRKEIVRKANQEETLGHIDGSAISMVILEQLTLVVREFTGGCLLSDQVLLASDKFVNEIHLRSQLLQESQNLWDKLYEHFCTLLRYRVMGPQEIAAVFVPGLVADKSENQDRAFSLIVRLLEVSAEDDAPDADISSVTFSSRENILLLDSPKKPERAEDVPTLSFGSMIDKQTDEESDFFDQSLPKDSVPLKETEAYRNMLSGTFSSGLHAEPQKEEDDTDDDVEKQFASVLSPRTPKSKTGDSSVRSPRPAALSTAPDPVMDDVMSEISSTSPPMSPAIQANTDQSGTKSYFGSFGVAKRNPALKTGSDLDSDTDLEFPISGGKTKSRTSFDDDFEFYG